MNKIDSVEVVIESFSNIRTLGCTKLLPEAPWDVSSKVVVLDDVYMGTNFASAFVFDRPDHVSVQVGESMCLIKIEASIVRVGAFR